MRMRVGKRKGSLDRGGKGEEGVVGGLRVDTSLMGKKGVETYDRSGSDSSCEENEDGGDEGGDGGHLQPLEALSRA